MVRYIKYLIGTRVPAGGDEELKTGGRTRRNVVNGICTDSCVHLQRAWTDEEEEIRDFYK